ncbi:MAG TPA: hypothetical protein VNP72_04460 [Longimicrobium sp.]|nr:hypothetical protein [Longimicrobium sp.]
MAAVRGGGRLSFYSVWAAPASRASLVGEWSRVGRCADPAVRLGYEQAIAGLGAVRGAGQAAETPEWEVALVVPRQQCASAAQRWRPARVPEPDLSALLGPLLDGEPPRSVVVDGDRVWAASVGRAVTARLVAGQPVETWSAEAPPGSSMRLLGRWEGDGVWVAVGSGGRVVRIWRGGGSG